MKKSIKKYMFVIKKYINDNILFLSYVFICLLLGLFLRIFTIGFPIYFKSIIGDLLILLLTALLGYLFKSKKRFNYYLILLTLFSIISVGNTIYYVFYQSFLSIDLLATASMVSDVRAAAFDKINIFQFLYILAPVLFFYINKHIIKNKEDSIKKSYILGEVVLAIILTLSLMLSLNKYDINSLINQRNREYIVSKYGIYIYHINDFIRSIKPRINTNYGYDEASLKFKEYYACKWQNKKEENEYTNYFKGKNLLIIHAESIQDFLIDLKINGKYVTPNLNSLAHKGMYFNKFYPQISIGTSSDSEFTLTTGLMPSSSGTVFVNYYDRKYYALPEYFNKLGYYTFSAHGNYADYWNRKTMHENLGYKKFYAKDSFVVPENENDKDFVGLGLSDKSFFKQLSDILVSIKENNEHFFGTIITLSNHSPFNDITKYGEFDVNMKYNYTDEDGNKKSRVATYLENTEMGNYIKSAHYADEALGEFINILDKKGILENTIIMLYGDHEAKLSKREFVRLYNYDPITDSIKSVDDPTYVSLENYNYDLLKNTPFIIWSKDKEYNKVISSPMGMYDVLPTLANMFGFEEKYSLGNDIFSSNEKIVVFPNGNVLTDKVYYNYLKDEYVVFSNTLITSDYIDKIKEYSNKILDVSSGIVVHNLILNEEGKVKGNCKK